MEESQIKLQAKMDDFSDDSETEIEFEEPRQHHHKTSVRSRIAMRQEGKTIREIKTKKESVFSEKFKSHAIAVSQNYQYICIFRGLRFTQEFFANEDRRRVSLLTEPSADIVGRTEYSSVCFRNAGFEDGTSLGKYISGRISEEDKQKLIDAETRTRKLIQFLYKKTDLKTKVNSRYFYESLLFALLNINTNIYATMDSVMKNLTEYLNKRKVKLGLTNEDIQTISQAYVKFTNEERKFDRKAFISTTLREEIAIGYALPYTEGSGESETVKGYNPEYGTTGKPKHRHGGMVEVILFPASEYIEECKKTGKMTKDGNTFKFVSPTFTDADPTLKFVDLHYSRYCGLLRPDSRIVEQFEANFLNTIDGKYVVASFPVYYPNFSKEYDLKYFSRTYGLSKAEYDTIKGKLATGTKKDYNEAMTILSDVLKKHYKILLETFVTTIMNNYEADGKKVQLFRTLPKINEAGEITSEKSLRSCTIHQRFTKKEQDKSIMEQDRTLKTCIAINTSPKKAGSYFGIPKTRTI